MNDLRINYSILFKDSFLKELIGTRFSYYYLVILGVMCIEENPCFVVIKNENATCINTYLCQLFDYKFTIDIISQTTNESGFDT